MVRQSNFAVGIAVGAGIGSALGLALHNLPVGVAIGTAIGVALGLVLPWKGKGATRCGPANDSNIGGGPSPASSTRL
jgi:F0F1-type ATP synthase assembly protein I